MNPSALYQGIVVSSQDPEGKNRITARVPHVLGNTISEWARPGSAIHCELKPGSVVWIAFPNGDTRYPIYYPPNDPAIGRIIPGYDQMAINGPSSGGIVLDSDVHAKRGDGGYVRVYASEFVTASSSDYKDNITQIPSNYNALQKIGNAPVYTWTYKPSYAASGGSGIGPLVENLPAEVKNEDGTVNLLSLVGVLWQALREQRQINQQLQNRISNLEDFIGIIGV